VATCVNIDVDVTFVSDVSALCSANLIRKRSLLKYVCVCVCVYVCICERLCVHACVYEYKTGGSCVCL
jgi:hypothetical protein